jgi:hypothetical protein
MVQVTAPLALVDSFATVATVITTPAAAESDSDYRSEIIRAYQTETQGGARTDYRVWAQDAPGVREVYPYVVSGSPGEIDLFVEATPADSTDGNGTPSAGLLSDVADVVEFDPDTSKPQNERGRRPISAWQINFLPVIPLPVDIEIAGLSDTNFLPTIKDNFEVFLYDIRPYLAGADAISDINKGKLFESDCYNIVRTVLGANATFTSLTLKVNSSIYSLYEFENENIPYIRNVISV